MPICFCFDDSLFESVRAWKVSIKTLAESGYNLDVKNPFVKEDEVTHTPAELLDLLEQSFKKSVELISELKRELA